MSSDSDHFVYTWARLLRIPNLFTVPGDVLAGFLLASGSRLSWPVLGGVLSVLFLYAGGLLLNDYCDREADARERPDRPIPSGAARAGTVLAVGMLALLTGIGIAFGAGGEEPSAVATAVAVAAFAYDAGLKKVPWLGPLVMGACRAGSVLVGAALAGGLKAAPVLAVAGIVWAYTATITILAARETSGARPRKSAYLPAIILASGAVVMIVLSPPSWAAGAAALFVIAGGSIRIVRAAKLVNRRQIGVPAFIGLTIRVMVFSQCAWCIWRAPQALDSVLIIAVIFLALFAGAELMSRWFYGS